MKLHVSEFGKICVKYPEKAREIVTGAFNAVPLDGDLTIESTAEGMDGAFYDLCMKAQNLRDDSLTPMDFKFHFFPWYKSIEYRLDPEGVGITSAFHEYFKTLKDDHGIELDDSQKAWYFKKSQEQDDDMGQEYPSFPEESFLQAGRPVFNNQKLAAQIKRAKDKPFEVKHFHIKSVDKELTVPVKIFKAPIKLLAYAVAGDPAEGLEDGDNSALSVLSKSFEQVAAYAGKLDPDLFGKLMVEVGKYFNNAILAPESNNHGYAVLQSIKNEKYLRVFRRETKEELGRDITEKLGWQNNVKTKMEMLDELKQCFREDILEINDEATLREMMTVVIEEDGNIIVNGKDRVVALGISIQAIKQAGLEGEFKAFTPGRKFEKDVTKMNIEDKIKYYNRIQRQ